MNIYIELGLSIALHFIGVCIAGVFLFYCISHVVGQARAAFDKTLWDTRELERIRVARQIVNGAGWFTPDECKLITIVGKNILKNNGSFDPSSARDEWHRECINRKDKP